MVNNRWVYSYATRPFTQKGRAPASQRLAVTVHLKVVTYCRRGVVVKIEERATQPLIR